MLLSSNCIRSGKGDKSGILPLYSAGWRKMHVMNSEEKVIKNEAWLISSLPWPLEGGSGVATYMYGRSTSASSKSSCCLALLGLHSHCHPWIVELHPAESRSRRDLRGKAFCGPKVTKRWRPFRCIISVTLFATLRAKMQ